MSAYDAKGGDSSNPNFDSPNISDEQDQERIRAELEAAERRERETAKIDGMPIEEKDQKFKSEDIGKREKTEYFINVEGAEKRARAIRQANDEMAAYLYVTAEEEYKEGVRKARKESEASKKEQKRAEGARKKEQKRAEEARKKEQKRAEEASEKEFRNQERLAKFEKRRNFWERNGKKIIITAVVLVVLATTGGILAKVIRDRVIEEKKEEVAIATYDKISEIRDLMYSGSKTASDDVINAYEMAIEDSEDADERFILEMSYVEYLIHYEKLYEKALEKLNVYVDEYDDKDQCAIVDNYIEIYSALGDDDNTLKYENIRTAKCTIGDNEDGYM